MSERISFVVPNGTIEKLKSKADNNGYSQSAFCRKIVLAELKGCDHLFAPHKLDGQPITNGNYSGPSIARCIKCGIIPKA